MFYFSFFGLGLYVTITLPVFLLVRKIKSPIRPDILSIPGINVTFAIIFKFLNLFHEDCSLFLGLMDAMPAVFFEIRMEFIHVVIVRHDLVFWRLGDIIAYGFDGVIVDEQTGSYFIADGTVCGTLLVQREGVP